jgi:hypothetical protein
MTALPQALTRRTRRRVVRVQRHELVRLARPRSEASKSDEWGTPRRPWGWVLALYRPQADIAASAENHLLPLYFTKKQNALKQDWSFGGDVERTFTNCPFSTGNKLAFTSRGRWHVLQRKLATSTHLLPHDTKDSYWHQTVELPEGRCLGVEKAWWSIGVVTRTHFRHLVVEKLELKGSFAFLGPHGTRSTARFSVVLVTFAQPGALLPLVQAPALLPP